MPSPRSQPSRRVPTWRRLEVIPLPSLGSVIIRDLTGFTAIKADNSGWRSPRTSWDGLRNIEVHENELLGEAYTPIGDI